MVNYATGAPIIQPMRYRSFNELPESSGNMGNSGSEENVYYQFVPAAVQDHDNYRRGTQAAYKRHLHAIENWAWLTQRLVEFEHVKAVDSDRRKRGLKASQSRPIYDSDHNFGFNEPSSDLGGSVVGYGRQYQKVKGKNRNSSLIRERRAIQRW